MAAQLAAKLAPLSPLTCSVALLTPVKSAKETRGNDVLTDFISRQQFND
jgi:hypothetical protein